MIPKGYKGIASWFWQRTAHAARTFPRDIERGILTALPLAVIKLPQLSPLEIANWLARRGTSLPLLSEGRVLRGALVAHSGAGIAFVDGSDAPEELRFTLAHETAHFILHYLLPRQELTTVLGPTAIEILDGHRPPTPEERLAATFAGVSIGEFRLLLDRQEDSHAPSPFAQRAEANADLLTFELLAPRNAIVARVRKGGTAPDHLRTTFGLPRWAAEAYGRMIEGNVQRHTGMRGWL